MNYMADLDDIDIEGDIPKNWPSRLIEQNFLLPERQTHFYSIPAFLI